MNTTTVRQIVPGVQSEAAVSYRKVDAALHADKRGSMAKADDNRPSRLKYGVAIGLLVFGLGLVTYQVLSQYHVPSAVDFRVYFSVDDGKTYFPEAEVKLPPFDHNGQQAVRAHVYNSPTGPFVGYLERYSPDALHILSVVNEAAKTAKPGDKPPAELAKVADAQRNGRQVKRPGAGQQWVPINSAAAQAVTRVIFPGSVERAGEINP